MNGVGLPVDQVLELGFAQGVQQQWSCGSSNVLGELSCERAAVCASVGEDGGRQGPCEGTTPDHVGSLEDVDVLVLTKWSGVGRNGQIAKHFLSPPEASEYIAGTTHQPVGVEVGEAVGGKVRHEDEGEERPDPLVGGVGWYDAHRRVEG